MTTDDMIDLWYDTNVDAEDAELMELILTAHAFELIADEIEGTLYKAVELGDDFGDYYWSSRQMVEKPGMSEYFND